MKTLVRGIIRPPRAEYDLSKVPLTSEIQGFGTIERTPVTFDNPAGHHLIGSFYYSTRPRGNLCVIYLHGNASNQLEGRSLIPLFVPVGVAVFCFDFSGCGLSTGPFVTLGFQEHSDVLCAAALLRRDFGIEKIALWGRSMGAAVTLLALPESDFVCGVIDSPYADLSTLFLEVGRSFHMPKWICKRSIKKARKKICRKTGCDIMAVRPLDSCRDCNKPVFFIHGLQDAFILPSHSQRLYDACPPGKKQVYFVEGTHCSDRPVSLILTATEYICGHLGFQVRFVHPVEPSAGQGAGVQHYASASDLLSNV
jgi:pimeloyl-ACP methyl ester carboxylesterase